MKPNRSVATALSLVALVSGAAITAGAGARYGQDDAYERLKSYDYQDRTAVAAIQGMIDQNLSDKAQTAQIEMRLVKVLTDPATTLGAKEEIGRMLWMIGTAQSVPALSKMLVDDKESDIARYALERNTDPSAGNALRAALGKTQGKTQVGIINSIGNRGDAAAVPDLKKYVASSDPLVTEASITALGKIGTDGALGVLRGVKGGGLATDHAILRVAEKLASEGKKARAEQVYLSIAGSGTPDVIRGEALRGLVGLSSPRATTVAMADLKSSDPYLQTVGAQVIGRLADPQAARQAMSAWDSVPAPAQIILLTAFGEQKNTAAASVALTGTKSADPNVRLAAIRAAGQTGGAASVGRLADIAAHSQGGERDAARDALATIPGAAADDAIVSLSKSGAPEVRATLTEVLASRATPGARAALLDAVQGTDAGVASEAARALARTGTADDQAKLVHILAATQSSDVRDAARDAVIAIAQRIGNRENASNTALAAYTGASLDGKAALLGVLAETGGDNALAALNQATLSDQPALMKAAVTGLAETWSDPRALPTLLRIAKSPSGDGGMRIQALRGYLRLVDQDEAAPAANRVHNIDAAVKAATRPDEKRYALTILQHVRAVEAVNEAALLLDDPEVSADAAGAILNLAAAQRRDNRDIAAVKGEATNAALDKVIRTTHEDAVKAQALALKS